METHTRDARRGWCGSSPSDGVFPRELEAQLKSSSSSILQIGLEEYLEGGNSCFAFARGVLESLPTESTDSSNALFCFHSRRSKSKTHLRQRRPSLLPRQPLSLTMPILCEAIVQWSQSAGLAISGLKMAANKLETSGWRRGIGWRHHLALQEKASRCRHQL